MSSSSSESASSMGVSSSQISQGSLQTKAIPLLNSLNQISSIKLDRTNFLLWHSLVLSALRGHRMDGFISGAKPAPPEYITDSNNNRVVNPDFEEWLAADQIVYSWLLSTMTPEVASDFLHCINSAQIYKAVTELMNATSRSRITMYRYELQRTRKGSDSITEYLSKMKTLCDNLSMAGSPIPESDLITQTLAGLDSEFTPIVVYLSDKDNLSWFDMHTRLLTFEKHLEHLNSVNGVSASFANVAISTNSGGSGTNSQNGGSRGFNSYSNGGSRGFNSYSNGQRSFNNHSNGQRSQRGGRDGRGSRGGRGGRSKPTCQVCNRQGHTAVQCFYRFDRSYHGQENLKSAGQNDSSAYVATPSTLEDPDWYMDSGATNHITHQNVPGIIEAGNISVGNGHRLKVARSAHASFNSSTSRSLNLNRVLVVPDIKKNLVSVAELTNDNNVLVEFDSSSCFVKDKKTNRILLKGKKHNGLYKMAQGPCFPSAKAEKNVDCTVFLSVLDNWHRRLGHASINTVKKVLAACNISLSKQNRSHFCNACQLGKAHALPFPRSSSRAIEPLNLVHTDLWGPAPVLSSDGYCYYICFVDDYSRFSWIYPLRAKSEALTAFVHFKAMVENQFDRKIKILQSDWGGEYRVFQKQLNDAGIIFRHSCPYTSAQNGRVERKHRHIVECGLSLLAQASMPLKFWWEAFSMAVHIINRLPTVAIGNSPYEALFGKKPDFIC